MEKQTQRRLNKLSILITKADIMARYIEDANFDFVETNKKLFCLKNYIQKELNKL